MEDEYSFREELRRQEEKSREAEKRAMTPKPDVFEQDARAELRQEKNRKESGVSEKNPAPDPDRERLLTGHASLGHPGNSYRDKALVKAIGLEIRVWWGWRQAPKAEGRLLWVDMEYGQIGIESHERSPSSLIIAQMKDITKWEIGEFKLKPDKGEGR